MDILLVLGNIRNVKYISPYLHLPVAYLIVANEKGQLIIKFRGNKCAQWISIDKVDTYFNEPYVAKVYNKVISKLKYY